MQKIKVTILHYSAPPVVGGVEGVMSAHCTEFLHAGYDCMVIAGRGDQAALPEGAEFHLIPEMDSLHPAIRNISQELENGRVPDSFDATVLRLKEHLREALVGSNHVIIHNVLFKHFNLPLTAALFELIKENQLVAKGRQRQWISWGHDFTWSSLHSRSKVYAGYPWELLKTYWDDLTYVVVSKARQQELAELLDCPLEKILVVYNGVDPISILNLSQEGRALVERLDLFSSDINLLMPVRVTEAKNIELGLNVVAQLKQMGVRGKLIVSGPPDPHDENSMHYYRSLQTLRNDLDVAEEVRFVFESGPVPDDPYTIGSEVVGDLYRVSDVLFMPSHREGFGIPILEAGLVGLPIFSTKIPAAEEIGQAEIQLMLADGDATEIARAIVKWLTESSTARLKRRVRQTYTWRSIFQRQVLPLLHGNLNG